MNIFPTRDKVKVKPSALSGPGSHHWEKYRDTAEALPRAYVEYDSGLCVLHIGFGI